jgi:hypothetical protein
MKTYPALKYKVYALYIPHKRTSGPWEGGTTYLKQAFYPTLPSNWRGSKAALLAALRECGFLGVGWTHSVKAVRLVPSKIYGWDNVTVMTALGNVICELHKTRDSNFKGALT